MAKIDLLQLEVVLNSSLVAEIERLRDELGMKDLIINAAAQSIQQSRDLAEIGEKAVRDRWFQDSYTFLCCDRDIQYGHAPDCKVPRQQHLLSKEQRAVS